MRLAQLADPMVFCATPQGASRMVSSYDRTGGNSDWADFASSKEGDLCILADLKGPGCVNRIWMTSVPADSWQFFFDGEKTPRIRVENADFFGKSDPFLPPISQYLSGASYSYFPLPFDKSLRIGVSVKELRPDARPFFHVNYEAYDPGTRVASYPKALSAAERNGATNVNAVWTRKGEDARKAAEGCTRTTNCVVLPGQRVAWLQHDGAGLLRAFRLRFVQTPEMTAMGRARQLREVSLRMSWDGFTEPSVNAPVGDFFCNGLYRREFSSLPISVLERDMVCRFPMPFRRGAKLELQNDGAQAVQVEIGYDLQPLDPSPEKDLNYFHAWWNSSTVSGVPHRVLTSKGRGHYVGCYLIVSGTDGTWNILESDESMYLDGESVASLHGTGLEDYFNGGWYYYGLFDLPLHGLVDKAAMRTAQYRFHLTDPVKFDSGMVMSWEFGHGNASRGYMSSVAYWYQPEPHAAGGALPETAKRFPPPDPLELSSVMVGLFELERIGNFADAAERALYYAEKFRGHEMGPVLRVRSAAYRELTEGFDAARPTYEEAVQTQPETPAGRMAKQLLEFHESPTNGLLAFHANMKVALFLDGQEVGRGQDPFSLHVFPVTLTSGEHELQAEVLPMMPGAWASFCLRTHGTNVISDTLWEYASSRPEGWPAGGDAAVSWTNIAVAFGELPKMAWWQFLPNAFVNMQSGPRLFEPARPGWDAQPYQPTYLRRRITIAE